MPAEPDPLEVAVRALRHRDLSASALAARLERAGVAPEEREHALETLERVGYVDDARFALLRARTLADRDWGDAAIAADLERQGVSAGPAAEAIAALAPERERALHVVAARGPGRKTVGYLARKGFDEDALEAVVDAAVAEEG
jgi:regulatory protein